MDIAQLKFNFEIFEIHDSHNSVNGDQSEPSTSSEIPKPRNPNSFSVKCKICSAVVKVSYSSFCNMKHHLNRKHSESASKIIGQVYSVDAQLKMKSMQK